MNILSGCLFVEHGQFMILDLLGITWPAFMCYRDDVPHKECHSQDLRNNYISTITNPDFKLDPAIYQSEWPRHGPDLELSESIRR